MFGFGQLIDILKKPKKNCFYRGKRSSYPGSIFPSFGKYISCPCISW